MARIICSICGRKVTRNRTAHLVKAHGLDARYKGAVREYYLCPEELGLPRELVDGVPEGGVLPLQKMQYR